MFVVNWNWISRSENRLRRAVESYQLVMDVSEIRYTVNHRLTMPVGFCQLLVGERSNVSALRHVPHSPMSSAGVNQATIELRQRRRILPRFPYICEIDHCCPPGIRMIH